VTRADVIKKLAAARDQIREHTVKFLTPDQLEKRDAEIAKSWATGCKGKPHPLAHFEKVQSAPGSHYPPCGIQPIVPLKGSDEFSTRTVPRPWNRQNLSGY